MRLIPWRIGLKNRLSNSFVVFKVLFLYLGILGFLSFLKKIFKGEYINLD